MDTAAFNLYVLDSWLPDWSGLGLCKHIRKRDRLGPICFFTHADVTSFRTSAVACGADLFLWPTVEVLFERLEQDVFRPSRLYGGVENLFFGRHVHRQVIRCYAELGFPFGWIGCFKHIAERFFHLTVLVDQELHGFHRRSICVR